jgi:hypothetical protein
MEKHSAHKPHYHYGANISGCFYVDIPDNTSKIVFSHNFLSLDTLNIFGVKDYLPQLILQIGVLCQKRVKYFFGSLI